MRASFRAPAATNLHTIHFASGVLFAAFGLLGNYAKIDLFFNVDYLFGSIFVLMAVRLLGVAAGTLIAAVAASYSFVLWNHPYAMIIFTAEALCVGLGLRLRRGNLVAWDILYWLVIGMPLVFLFYHYVMGMEIVVVRTVMLKQAINGISNAILAALLLYACRTLPSLSRLFPHLAVFSYKEFLFSSIMAFVLVPGMVGTTISSRGALSRLQESIESRLLNLADYIQGNLDVRLGVDQRILSVLADMASRTPLDLQDIREAMKAFLALHSDFLRVEICTPDGKTVAAEATAAWPEWRLGDSPEGRQILRERRASVTGVIPVKAPEEGRIAIMTVPVQHAEEYLGMAFGIFNPDYLRDLLESSTERSNLQMSIQDGNGVTVASSSQRLGPGGLVSPEQQGDVQMLPGGTAMRLPAAEKNISVMERWRKAVFFKKAHLEMLPGWSVVVEEPMAPHMFGLLHHIEKSLYFMMALIFLALPLSLVLPRLVVRPLLQLERLTSDLPERLESGALLVWPDVVVIEAKSLLDNFRRMAESLAARFSEIRQANTELAAARAAAEGANEAKSLFLATMSHELRTPMGGILGMTELLSQTPLSQEQGEYVHLLETSARTLLCVLNDILDFSKIEAGKLRLNPVAFELRRTVKETVELMAAPAAEQGNALEWDMRPEVPDVLEGDPVRFQQILLNLLSNAIKFTQNGTVRVEVSLERKGDEGLAVLRCGVRDTGIGIPAEKIPAIFDRFTQVHRQLQVSAGTGLGLSIVKRLVEAMGGDVSVESREGEGSQFTFTVRMRSSDASALKDADAKQTSLKPNKPCNILVAEDNSVNQLVIKRLLEKLGHRVTLAGNGRQAISELHNDRFDCVFMDVEMPEMGGLEATRRIRAGEAAPHVPDVPIVALTAHALDGDRERFLAAGMNEYVTKPFDSSRLAQVLSQVARS